MFFKYPMAAGNAESVTNGVTGVGSIEVQAHVFPLFQHRFENPRDSVFPPAFTGHSATLRSRLPFLVFLSHFIVIHKRISIFSIP